MRHNVVSGMATITPTTAADLAENLRAPASRGEPILLEGGGSKRSMGGPVHDAAVHISTRGLTGILEFEPRDLTIRAAAGLPWRELEAATAASGLCVPLEPMHAAIATVGGVVASNSSGPRRRLFGTARDLVIGMEYATLEGQLLESGGMVVKNVAGLDIQKLLIGSLGTLAAITSVSFKLSPLPEATRTWIFSSPDAQSVSAHRDGILRSVLQPAALDVLNPAAARTVGYEGFVLLLRAQGPESVLQRYARELPGATLCEGQREIEIWSSIREWIPRQLESNPEAVIVRTGWPMPDLAQLLASSEAPLLARAGTGAAWLAFPARPAAEEWMRATTGRAWSRVIEFAPESEKASLDQWPDPGADLDLMRSMKALFDPQSLLNRGRLYGRL